MKHSKDILYKNQDYQSYLDKYKNLLNVTKISEYQTRSAEIFCFKKENKFVGLLVLHYYLWEILALQKGYKIIRKNGTEYIKILNFSQLISNKEISPKLSAELATLWVEPNFRNQTIGKYLFNIGIEKFVLNLSKNDIFFLSVVSRLDKKNVNLLFDYVSSEGALNPNKELPLNETIDDLGIKPEELNVSQDSFPMEILAIQQKMNYWGHFRSFSKIFGKII